METIIQYVRQYFYEVDKRILTLASLLVAILIFLNYYYSIDKNIGIHHSFLYSFVSRYFIFLIAFMLPYLFYNLLKKRSYTVYPVFIFLLVLSPTIFSLKVAMNIPLHFSDNVNWNDYWNNIFYWPVRLVIVGGILFIIWKLFDNAQPFLWGRNEEYKMEAILVDVDHNAAIDNKN